MSEEELMIEILKCFVEDENTGYVNDWQGFDYEIILPRIQQLLDLYNKEKEKNKELEKKLKVAKQLYNDSCICIATECVEKDKIKDKIDWYKTQQIKYSELDMLKDVVITNQKITLLESLLKEE